MWWIIMAALFAGGYMTLRGKGAKQHWCLVAAVFPAALCFFFGIIGLLVAALLLGSYGKIQLA